MITPGFSLSRRTVTALLVAAAGMALTACQSALSTDYQSASSDRFYESLVAREIVRGTYGQRVLDAGTAPTLIGPVHEIVRVDSPGPATAPYPAPYTSPTTAPSEPTTNPSLATSSLIGVYTATLHDPEKSVPLSLQDAIARTVMHSLAIKVEAYNPALKESLIIEAQASGFDPVFFGSSQWSVNDDPQISTSFSNGHAWNNSLGIRRVLPIGTQIQATTNLNYRDIAVPPGTLGAPSPKSSYAANINLQIVQPLLKGFGENVNQAGIYLAQRDLRISKSEFKQKVMNTVADVEDAYQNLVLAQTNVDVLEHLVVASEQTYRDVKARIDIDATTASVNQALSALESRRADLHVAQKTLRNASDRLKTLINDPALDINSNILINPLDRPLNPADPKGPVVAPPRYDTIDAIATALRQRPEMQQARLQLERADIVITVARNDLLPKVDLTLAMQANGLDHGADQAISQTIDPMNNLDFSVGIKFEIPIGNRDNEAKLQRHLNERNQAIANLVQVAQNIALNVKQQIREVYSSYEEIYYRDRVRQAAANEFQGIIDIENIRPRSPEFLQLKLDSQARLAQAAQQLTQTIVNYNLAVMRLEQAQGTLLEFDRISLDKAPKPKEDPLQNALRLQGSTYLTK